MGIQVPQTLVHGISAEDWMSCWNTQLRGALASADLLNEFGSEARGVREMSVGELRAGAFEGFMSPAMIRVWQAAILRSGGSVGEGVPPYPTRVMPRDVAEKLVRRVDLELRLEEARRHVAPGAPSRLTCLFLADDSVAGRAMVSRLKGHDAFMMAVRISLKVRLARLDASWLEGRVEEVGESEIFGYRSGEARDDPPDWEYLLDGAVECTDPDELERLKVWGVKAAQRASGTQGPIGTPRSRSAAGPKS